MENDKYGITTYELESRRKAFLSNPSGWEEDDPYLYIAFDGNVPIGRTMFFRSRLKAGDVIIPIYSGSAFDVVESYRKEGVGGYVFWDGYKIEKRNPQISAGISDDAIPLFRRLKNVVFEFPRMMQLRDSKPLLKSKGFEGPLLVVVSGLFNVALHSFYNLFELFSPIPRGYELRLMTQVPEWVDNIVLNDGHKYMEVHDHQWLQWCLDNKFTDVSQDRQSFYGVFRSDEPVAFFMINIRYRNEIKGIQDVVLGSIMEWGVSNNSTLCEFDLYKMAKTVFPKDVSIIQAASDDICTLKKMKQWGFVHHGDARISFKDKKKKITDANDPSLWRLRFGYTDVILF